MFRRMIRSTPSQASLSGALRISLILVCIVECSLQQQMSNVQSDRLEDVQVHEYCLTEVFEPTCLKNELIVMKTATYGRMRMGRCLEDEGSDMQASDTLGCFVDVLHLLDQKCSGRNRCAVRVADAELIREKPCRKMLLTAYLEAEYECVAVIEEDRTCIVQARSTSNPLHIMHSSSSSSKLSCGTKSQPWRLEAPAGQQINVSLLDFGIVRQASSILHHPNKNCHQTYGYIIEKSGRKNISICAADQRMTNVYKSSTNIIEIVLNYEQHSGNQETSLALIRFTAVGCSNLVPPEDTWLRRNDNEAVVGCYSSRQTWHLHCIGNNWVGVIGNCTREAIELPVVQSVSSSPGRDYQTLILVAIVCFGVGICLIIICIGVMCLRRYSSKADVKKILHCQDATGLIVAPLT